MNAHLPLAAMSPELAELHRDTGVIPSRDYLADARADVLDDVLSGQCVRAGNERMDLQQALWACFSEDERDDMLARLMVQSLEPAEDRLLWMRKEFERRLREKLEGSALVQAKAAQMMEREREWDERDGV